MNPYIWCDCCERIQPLLMDVMIGDDVTGEFTNATDLMCSECRLVIATTYTPKQSPPQPDTQVTK